LGESGLWLGLRSRLYLWIGLGLWLELGLGLARAVMLIEVIMEGGDWITRGLVNSPTANF